RAARCIAATLYQVVRARRKRGTASGRRSRAACTPQCRRVSGAGLSNPMSAQKGLSWPGSLFRQSAAATKPRARLLYRYAVAPITWHELDRQLTDPIERGVEVEALDLQQGVGDAALALEPEQLSRAASCVIDSVERARWSFTPSSYR